MPNIIVTLFIFIAAISAPAMAQPAPNGPCTNEGNVTNINGDEGQVGGYKLICHNGLWNTVLGFGADGALTQLGNLNCAAHQTLAFDGTKWACSTPDHDSICGGIGGVCPDGTIYAGLSPDGRAPIYTTPADAPTLMTWGPNTDTEMQNCSITLQEASCRTGRANTTLLAAKGANYEEARYCENLDAHGHTDWYLPSIREMQILYANKEAIGGFARDTYYRSSSESNATHTWYRGFFVEQYGGIWWNHGSNHTKATRSAQLKARCIRR